MQPATGILLINLGTPEAPDVPAVRRYLREFLSDPRVIERRGWRWKLILNGILLPRRSKSFSHAYSQIWNHERGESPLKTITRAQAEGLADRFAGTSSIHVGWAMRYGQPSISQGIGDLAQKGCTRLLIFPLYPQYSGATTASAMDRVFDCLKGLRWQPTLRVVPPYFDDPAHIGALAGSVRQHRATLGWVPDATVLSFHGLPEAFIENGDPYRDHCTATARLLREALAEDESTMPVAYQSSSGRPGWLGPELEDVLAGLAAKGARNLVVAAPGFAADCVETLEEIAIRAAAHFTKHGGRNFALCPCLNDSDASVAMLHDLAARNLAGWLPPDE